MQQGKPPILLVSPQIRPGLRQMTQASMPRLVVLSYNEITRDTKIEALGMIEDVKYENETMKTKSTMTIMC